jgi:hypothetical protein
MVRRVAYLAASALMALSVGGCALNFLGMGEPRESWRDAVERACLRQRVVVETAFIQRVKEIDGRGACGIDRPLKISAFSDGRVSIGPTATLGCPMTAALETWIQTSVQPAAIAWFGMPVVEISQMGTYSCRTRNNVHGARLSEHAFGNALDIGGFKLASGRVVKVKGEYLRGSQEAQGFLREVFAGACAQFKTVLGPGAAYHGDHFHLDLAHHNAAGTSRYCKPTPSVPVPSRPPYRGDVIASTPRASGPILAEAPASVVRETRDPFGVSEMREQVAPSTDWQGDEAGYSVAGEGMGNAGGSDGYSVAGDGMASAGPDAGYQRSYEPVFPSVEDSIGAMDPSYVTPPQQEAMAAAAPPAVPQRALAPPTRRQGFLSWFFKPPPIDNSPLSYAPLGRRDP